MHTPINIMCDWLPRVLADIIREYLGHRIIYKTAAPSVFGEAISTPTKDEKHEFIEESVQENQPHNVEWMRIRNWIPDRYEVFKYAARFGMIAIMDNCNKVGMYQNIIIGLDEAAKHGQLQTAIKCRELGASNDELTRTYLNAAYCNQLHFMEDLYKQYSTSMSLRIIRESSFMYMESKPEIKQSIANLLDS